MVTSFGCPLHPVSPYNLQFIPASKAQIANYGLMLTRIATRHIILLRQIIPPCRCRTHYPSYQTIKSVSKYDLSPSYSLCQICTLVPQHHLHTVSDFYPSVMERCKSPGIELYALRFVWGFSQPIYNHPLGLSIRRTQNHFWALLEDMVWSGQNIWVTDKMVRIFQVHTSILVF
jgi:hypothetical protein